MWEVLGLVLPSTHTRKERQKKVKRIRSSRGTSDRKKIVEKNYNYNITNRTPALKHSQKPRFEGTGNQNDAHDQTQTDRQEDNDIKL